MHSRVKRRGKLFAVAGAGALCISLLPASPAAAAAGDVEVVGFGDRVAGRIVRASCRVTGVLISLDRLQLVVEADASALPDGLLTTVYCEASSSGGGSVVAPSISCPGPVCASAGTGQVGLGTITVCVTATGDFGPLLPEEKTVSYCANTVGARVDQDFISS